MKTLQSLGGIFKSFYHLTKVVDQKCLTMSAKVL